MRRVIVVMTTVLVGLWIIGPAAKAQEDAGNAVYEQKLAQLMKQEVDTLAELAEWCQKNDLPQQADDLVTQALTLDPKHEAANKVLEQLRGDTWRPRSFGMELLLVDGSRLKGTANLREITLNTSFGMLRYPPKQVELVVFNFVDGQDLVIADDLTMVGKAGVGSFQMETKVGQVNVEETSLKEMRLVRLCSSCNGKLKTLCTHCQGRGVVEVRKPCPACKGVDSKKQCVTCQGAGSIPCPRCNGTGITYSGGRRGFPRPQPCPDCKGTGKMSCPDCRGKGEQVCPACKGMGTVAGMGTCPVCGGAKMMPCDACQGTGEQPAPKPVWPIPAEGETEPQTQTDKTPVVTEAP